MRDHQIKIGDEVLTVAQLSTAQIRRLISGIENGDVSPIEGEDRTLADLRERCLIELTAREG